VAEKAQFLTKRKATMFKSATEPEPSILVRPHPAPPPSAMLLGNGPEHARLLHAFVANSATHIAFVTRDFKWGYVNPAAASVLGKPAQELIGHPIAETHVNEFRRPLHQTVSTVLETGKTCECDALVNVATSEHPRWMRVRVQPYRDDNGHMTGVIVTSNDVHNEMVARTTAFTQNELIERHLDNGHAAFVQMDTMLRVQRWSTAAQRLFGWTAEQAVGRRLLELLPIHEDDRATVRIALRQAQRQSNDTRVHIRSRTQSRAGELLWCDWFATHVSIPELGAQSLFFFAVDITESIEAREALTRAAQFDALTGMPNRHAFYDWLNRRLHQPTPQGHVLFIDLDGFKEVNDRYGHETGDRLLQLVAHRLSKWIAALDTGARYGGDEFTLFISERLGGPPVTTLAENIISDLRRPFELNELDIELSCSVGIAAAHDGLIEAQALVSNADMAMLQAKANGRDQYVLFTPSLGERHRARSLLHGGLRDALRAGQLAVAYQPRVDIHSGEIIGAEALARWTLPDGTHVNPNDFIPVAEETGLIHDLGAFVLQRACELARDINKRRPAPLAPFVVSVNLSTIQLRQPQFVKRVKAIFASAGCPPHWIEFEVTESRELTEPLCVERLDELVNRFGARCSLDDFGTGYSNLLELTLLPITALKIDRSFVAQLTPANSSVVAAVVALGKSLKLEIVAEGVETHAQLHQLREMGAASYQGFLHSRAMHEAQLQALVANRGFAQP
jgi:diguanylate cyclase (GGDEF)-like protein/PAS domain S-box-containing protein